MKRRWTWLFTSALLTMVGAMWLGQRHGIGLHIGLETIGMTMAMLVAFVALVRNSPSKWFAGGALLCSVPALFTVIVVFDEARLGELIEGLGFPFVLIVGGILSTVIAGCWILFRAIPLPPVDDPIARAKIVD